MSRKTLLAIIGVIGAILTFLKTEFGLVVNVTGLITWITGILLYVFYEAKLDAKRIGLQLHRFKDPKFLLALLITVITAISESFGLNLPIEVINTVLVFIMSLLFGKDIKKANNGN